MFNGSHIGALARRARAAAIAGVLLCFWTAAQEIAVPVVEAENAPAAAHSAGPVAGTGNSERNVTFGAPQEILTLEAAQRRALSDNPSLLAASERVEQTKSLIWQARSMYFPQIDLNYRMSYTWLPDAITEPANTYLDEAEVTIENLRRDLTRSQATRLPFPSQRHEVRTITRDLEDAIDWAREKLESPQDGATLMATAGYLVFDGFSRKFTNAMARFGHKEAAAAYREGQRLLLDGVAQAYYGVQLARESARVAEGDIAFNERLLHDAKARREAGRGPTSDVLNFEVAMRAARGSLLKAQRDYETARIALAVLMGLPDGSLPEEYAIADLATETPEDMQAPVDDEMIEYALSHRPDLEQREFGLKRAEANVKDRYADFSPQVAAFATAQAQSITNSGIDEDEVYSSVGVNVSFNLFSGGRRVAKVIEAKHARREAEYRLSEVENKAAGEVHQAVLDVTTAQQALILNRSAAEYVERNRDLVDKEYTAGKTVLVRLSLAQRDLVQAQGQLALARVALQRSWHALRTATGMSLEGVSVLEQGLGRAQQP